jgi:hypothetical protein
LLPGQGMRLYGSGGPFRLEKHNMEKIFIRVIWIRLTVNLDELIIKEIIKSKNKFLILFYFLCILSIIININILKKFKN